MLCGFVAGVALAAIGWLLLDPGWQPTAGEDARPAALLELPEEETVREPLVSSPGPDDSPALDADDERLVRVLEALDVTMRAVGEELARMTTHLEQSSSILGGCEEALGSISRRDQQLQTLLEHLMKASSSALPAPTLDLLLPSNPTLADFQRLRHGMTFSDMLQIVGYPDGNHAAVWTYPHPQKPEHIIRVGFNGGRISSLYNVR